MGVLVPLYLAGLAALSLPLIFHLVRRTPRTRQSFSSLMFLSPSPPRLTRRSRLDQLLLLVLRLAALALLAFAFSRPFLREASSLTAGDLPGRKVAILIDASASMHRADLWRQAIQHAEQELKQLNPQDDVALYSFAALPRTIVGFEWEPSETIANKVPILRGRLQALEPTWEGTDLGSALATVAAEMESSTDARQSFLEPQIVVISDFQKGTRIDALTFFEWPSSVRFVPRPVFAASNTNAFAQRLPSEEEEAETSEVRVRVANAADSRGDQFFLNWGTERDSTQSARRDDVAVYVPPGQSRVVRLPRNMDRLDADRIMLRGDDHPFDNTFHLVPLRTQKVTLLALGQDAADDQQGLQYYLRLAVANDPLRKVEVLAPDPAQAITALAEPELRLTVVSQPLSAELQTALKSFVENGGSLLLIPTTPESASTLPLFLEGLQLDPNPKESPGEYLLLGEIDFTHPLFAPFASPRYNDFTKIHFWKHRHVVLAADTKINIVARFDNGDPAVLETALGAGRVIALASGWQPDESQFAFSSKFVPFIAAVLDQACGSAESSSNVAVNEPITLPVAQGTTPWDVRTPAGKEIRIPSGEKTFAETSEPGIYRAQSGPAETRFTVNLAASESDTAPMELEQLEQRGVRFDTGLSRRARIEKVRQQRDTELEGRQKVWRWLIVAAIGALVLETWWAGRAERKILTALHKNGV